MATKEALKWLGRTSISAIFWVFILSIRYDGRTLFSYANNFLVQNSFLQVVDSVANTLFDISDVAKMTFSDSDGGKDGKTTKGKRM